MKTIYTQKYKAPVMVDDEDYEYLNQFNWFTGKNGYIVRNYKKPDGRWSRMAMHREVLKVDKGMDTEHKDRNRSNNQKSNLRPGTRSENMANVNRKRKPGAHSKYKGVSRLKRANLKRQWMAYIKVEYKMYYLGYYETETEAGHIYNVAAEQVFGEFACLNDLDDTIPL